MFTHVLSAHSITDVARASEDADVDEMDYDETPPPTASGAGGASGADGTDAGVAARESVGTAPDGIAPAE